jgi:hypothetical protein
MPANRWRRALATSFPVDHQSLDPRAPRRAVATCLRASTDGSYVAPDGDPAASRVFDHPGLRVFAASPEHLLAMKAFAARPRDAEDIRQLVQVLNLRTVEDVLASVREIFPEEEPPGLRLLLEDIFTEKE